MKAAPKCARPDSLNKGQHPGPDMVCCCLATKGIALGPAAQQPCMAPTLHPCLLPLQLQLTQGKGDAVQASCCMTPERSLITFYS
jgi:hypothetical protein